MGIGGVSRFLLCTYEPQQSFRTHVEQQVENAEIWDESESVGSHLPVWHDAGLSGFVDPVGISGALAACRSVCHLCGQTETSAYHCVETFVEVSDSGERAGVEQRHKVIEIEFEIWRAAVCAFQGSAYHIPPAAVRAHTDFVPCAAVWLGNRHCQLKRTACVGNDTSVHFFAALVKPHAGVDNHMSGFGHHGII